MSNDGPTREVTRWRLLAVATLVGVVSVACAAEKRPAAPPAGAPRKAGPMEEADQAARSETATTERKTAGEPSAQPAIEPGDSARRREIALRHAREDVEQAFTQVGESMASGCASACRALASLERAVGHLCQLSKETDERERCEDARRRYEKARARVRAECVTCAGGPKLDPGEPLP